MADPLGITASIIAVLQLTSVVAQYLKDVKGGSGDRLRLREEIRSTVALLEILKDRVEDEDEDTDMDAWRTSVQQLAISDGPLDQFKRSLERLIKKLVPGGKLEQFKKGLTWPFDKNDVEEILRGIERQKSLFSLALENDHL
jgi:hypothetical protein